MNIVDFFRDIIKQPGLAFLVAFVGVCLVCMLCAAIKMIVDVIKMRK